MHSEIGDRGAQRLTNEEITEFYEKHSDDIFRLCMSYLGNTADSADAVQETFLRWIESSDCSRSSGHELGRLVITAGNVCKDILRRRKRHPRESLDSAFGIGSEEKAFSYTEVYDAVLSLPDKYKNVIFLFYYKDMTVAEISEATGMKRSTVTSLLTRARRLLGKALGDDHNG